MKYRDKGAGGDLFSFIEHREKVVALNLGICKLNDVIDWEIFRPRLEKVLGYSDRDPRKGGRPPFDPVMMLKVLVLQKYHGLSDHATETQIADRFSFLRFLGLSPGDDIPDENTIWDFREALASGHGAERDCGFEGLFDEFLGHLEAAGMVGHEGSLVDATFVEAPRQRNSREENQQIKEGRRPKGFEPDTAKGRQKDCDARWTKKGGQNHYGYKNHAKVDAKSKLITRYKATPASVHDSQMIKDLVDEKDNALFADSAYAGEEIETYILETCDCEDFIQLRPYRNRPLNEEDKQTNKLRSRIRCRVEHVFGRLEHMGANNVRGIGLKRAAAQIGLANLVYNIDRFVLLRRNQLS